MGDYEDSATEIPWASLGRETVASRLGWSLLPVGTMPFEPEKPTVTPTYITSADGPLDRFLMDIKGTAFQAGHGKLVTCGHVIEAVAETRKAPYLLARRKLDGAVAFTPYRYEKALRYVDPRSMKVNKGVDLAVIIAPVRSTPEMPYEVPNIRFGRSQDLGVGDRILVGGYPLGTALFLANETHRGYVQPTFYEGIVSAIIPALSESETRLLQLSMPVEGGMSGGAVFHPGTGDVLGMIFAGLTHAGTDASLPFTYAIPSEVIEPFVRNINFKTTSDTPD